MQKLRERFAITHPGKFFLDPECRTGIERYLLERSQLAAGETVLSAERAGDGNMNCTLRVTIGCAGSRRAVIVKQSRDWVEKFPEIEAPADRILNESRFYLLASPCEEIAARMPKLLDLDADALVMTLEDVGQSCDFTGVYRGQTLAADTVATLADWLSQLHSLHMPDAVRQTLQNRSMRRLNHTHIFQLPLDPKNGLDLDAITPGLGRAARALSRDVVYEDRVKELGEAYLSDGPCLLHGDVYPGSWLATTNGPIVIDPEFAFFGRPEFDVGVLLGHLHLSGQPGAVFDALYQSYRPQAGFDWSQAVGYAGVEIMRRLIGVAQLPLDADFDRKRELLDLSKRCVLEPADCLPARLEASAG